MCITGMMMLMMMIKEAQIPGYDNGCGPDKIYATFSAS